MTRLPNDLASALRLPIIAAQESMAVTRYKNMLVSSSLDDVLLSRAFTGLPSSTLKPSIVAAGLDPNNSPQRGTINISEDINAEQRPKRWKDIWSAGHSVSAVSNVPKVADLVDALAAAYAAP